MYPSSWSVFIPSIQSAGSVEEPGPCDTKAFLGSHLCGRIGTASPVLISSVLEISQGHLWQVPWGWDILPVSTSETLGVLRHVLRGHGLAPSPDAELT